MSRRTAFLLATLTATSLVVTTAAQANAAQPSVTVATASGTFAAYTPGARAVTYQPDLVPVGAHAEVISLNGDKTGTTVLLAVTGLLPGHEYGAHAHALPCGATGAAAGPHFQNTPDPVTPSVDPAYANPHNEVWLDFTTDESGAGAAYSHLDWAFGERRAHSVVIHEMHTHTDPGHAGTAGGRSACITVDF